MYITIYIYIYISYVRIYIYIYREREREIFPELGACRVEPGGLRQLLGRVGIYSCV